MSSPKLLASLKGLHQERRRLLQRLTARGELAVGSVSVVRRRCGKPNCHCAQGPGHPQTLFLFRGEDGRRKCKLIRKADSERLLQAGQLYRGARQALRKLRTMNQREEKILVALMEARRIRYE
jgi:hypothetical protein